MITQVVAPDDAQRAALDGLRETTRQAAETLASTCPQAVPAAPAARLEAVEQAIDAASVAFAAVQPALEGFYGTLDDEQKARIVRGMEPQKAQASRSRSARAEQDLRRGLTREALAGERLVTASLKAADTAVSAGQAEASREVVMLTTSRACGPPQTGRAAVALGQVRDELAMALPFTNPCNEGRSHQLSRRRQVDACSRIHRSGERQACSATEARGGSGARQGHRGHPGLCEARPAN